LKNAAHTVYNDKNAVANTTSIPVITILLLPLLPGLLLDEIIVLLASAGVEAPVPVGVTIVLLPSGYIGLLGVGAAGLETGTAGLVAPETGQTVV
jgi:hypothetical protein